ncbi:MAG: carbohydrate-binding domain-containing protein [Candidatus Methanomethylophilaceae archaeon]|nr:carbohydrate-binding domain-containing protein [Candidatus Methanomethylophilaceae archaeon]
MLGNVNVMLIAAVLAALFGGMAAVYLYDGHTGGVDETSQSDVVSDSEPTMTEPTAPAMPADGQFPGASDGQTMPSMPGNQTMPAMPGNQTFPGDMGGQTQASSGTVGEIMTSDVTNTAKDLVADMDNVTTIVMSDENNQVKITESGTYLVTGTCADGNIVVKKGTTGVVLILKDLDLTSTTGATVSINKAAEVKLVIEGTVKLTDAEDPSDEDSTDADVADAFDGAALKAKDGSNVCLTGTGTLTIDASSCKNGIKVGNEDTPSFVIDGDLTIRITAANDGINSGYDLTILGGTLVISAGDDAIHADRILTIGSPDGSGPSVTVTSSTEGLEGTVVNLFGGDGTVRSTDDAVNAANGDGTYVGVLTYSVNVTGGTWTLTSNADGLDSNGNVNMVGGTVTIRSASVGGDAGIDYDGQLYVSSEATLNNYSGTAGPDRMPGGMGGQMPGQQTGGAFPGQMMGGMFAGATA